MEQPVLSRSDMTAAADISGILDSHECSQQG
jgi:hypothetical protein